VPPAETGARRDPGVHASGQPDPARGRVPAIVATLVAGTTVLGVTLAVSSGSVAFFALGGILAATWIVGGIWSGWVPWSARERSVDLRVDVVVPLLLGTAVFGAFVVAKLVADHVPFLEHSTADVLARAHDGSTGVVLVVALFNGVGEEVFFRGALQSALSARLGSQYGAVWATVIYAAVTVATLNPALVVAALALGAILAIERRVVGGVLGPVLTHLSWSALIILFLPR
jgi:membrane protease YdiL (CAAX protease family)